MSNNIVSKKHKWSYYDNHVVSKMFLEGKNVKEISMQLPYIKPSSIRAKYANCLYLNNETVVFGNVSKYHIMAWNDLKK